MLICSGELTGTFVKVNDTLIAYALDHRRSRYLLTITYSLAEDVTVVSACAATCDVDKLQCRPKSLQTARHLQVYTDLTCD